MQPAATTDFVPLTDDEFAEFQRLIHQWAGIHMNDTKKALITGRLMKRLRHHALTSYSDYLKIIKAPENREERQIMINLLTTNETYFFREPKHFDWLREKIRARKAGEKFRVWSAACSSGEEIYSLAMVLADEMGFDGWEIVGSDISERMLSTALEATYPLEDVQQIPEPYRKRFCLKGINELAGKFSIRPELLRGIYFYHLNLIEKMPAELGKFDVIFLRNVMIYFDRETRKKVTDQLAEFLKSDGNLVIGHAESLHGITESLRPVRPTIYAPKHAAT